MLVRIAGRFRIDEQIPDAWVFALFACLLCDPLATSTVSQP
ncbi:hypothetical protein [Microtetraspora sp. NBRC 16547]|nr:hypothetical protein [Microtetraspora sp. NBRC 16547]